MPTGEEAESGEVRTESGEMRTENYAAASAAFRFPLSAYFTTSFLYAVPAVVAMRTM